jgi:hypothetical protein
MKIAGGAYSSDFAGRYARALEQAYPETARALANGQATLSPTSLSPHAVPVSASTIASAERIASAFYRLRESPGYIAEAAAKGPYPASADPGNRGALMSFDFHLAEGGALKLIEINTNASMGLMGDLAYRAQGLPNPLAIDFRGEIVATFRAEALASRLGRPPKSILIADRAPEKQNLFIEFLAYRELFRQNGIECEVCDTAEIEVRGGRARSASLPGFEADLVYNRDVDFYLLSEASRGLRSAFEHGHACVTPNPVEYQLLADKARLQDLLEPGLIERCLPGDAEAVDAIRGCLLESRPVASFSPEALWASRKRWFFKPARAFGGKGAYRGSSIGRKAFASLFAGDFIAQEYAPPPVLSLPGASGGLEEFKYDLRFFVYRGRAQLAIARLYQGQVTNAQVPGGGCACLALAGD